MRIVSASIFSQTSGFVFNKNLSCQKRAFGGSDPRLHNRFKNTSVRFLSAFLFCFSLFSLSRSSPQITFCFAAAEVWTTTHKTVSFLFRTALHFLFPRSSNRRQKVAVQTRSFLASPLGLCSRARSAFFCFFLGLVFSSDSPSGRSRLAAALHFDDAEARIAHWCDDAHLLFLLPD